MNITKIIILVAFVYCSSTSVSAQSFFRGSIVAGLNAAQIDGDQLAGYHKFGFSAGAKVEFPLSSSFDMGIEFLLSQRGSRSRFVKGQFIEPQRIHLNYAAIPLVVKWNDWWIAEEEYYKFNIHSGFAFGRLISSNANFNPSSRGEIVTNDYSVLIGAGFAFTKHWAIRLRFTRSLNTLYMQETSNQTLVKGLIGYFITLRSEYTF